MDTLMDTPDSLEAQVERQIGLAERNNHRRLRLIMWATVIAFSLGLLAIWVLGFSPECLAAIAACGGTAGFLFNQVGLKKSSCPRCGSDWEMRSLDSRYMPITRFYLKECPYCGLKVAAVPPRVRTEFLHTSVIQANPAPVEDCTATESKE
jgi:hypothetical protein